MAIGDLPAYSVMNGVQWHKPLNTERSPVTLDATVDPKKPNEYSVRMAPPVIRPPEKTSDIKYTAKRPPQNTDPVSNAFNAIADYGTRTYRIDVYV